MKGTHNSAAGGQSAVPAGRVLEGVRIAFIAGTLGQGGAERQLHGILRVVQALGGQPQLLYYGKGEYWEERIRDIGVPIIRIDGGGGKLRRLLTTVRQCLKLRPSVIQSQHFYTSLYAALAGAACRCVSIGAVRNDVASEIRDVGGLLGRWSLKMPQWIAVNSRAAEQYIAAHRLRTHGVRFLPNVVAPRVNLSTREAPRQELRIVGVGRLEKQKRFDHFLEVVARLSRNRRIQARIAGDGSLKQELKSLAAAKGLSPGTVEFCGKVSNTAALYDWADVLLMTSDHEGTPNVVLEAMASGLPVVATSVGDVPYLIGRGERGGLVAKGDVEGLLNGIESLDQHDAWMRRCSEALNFVQKQHSEEALRNAVQSLLLEAMK